MLVPSLSDDVIYASIALSSAATSVVTVSEALAVEEASVLAVDVVELVSVVVLSVLVVEDKPRSLISRSRLVSTSLSSAVSVVSVLEVLEEVESVDVVEDDLSRSLSSSSRLLSIVCSRELSVVSVVELVVLSVDVEPIGGGRGGGPIIGGAESTASVTALSNALWVMPVPLASSALYSEST